MATETLDCKGMACPQPILKVQAASMKLQPGDAIEVYADCSTFSSDINNWCSRMGKVLVFCNDEGGVWHAQVQL